MSAKTQVPGRFKSKGTSILHTGKDRPDSMHEFLREADERPKSMDDKICINLQKNRDEIAKIRKNTLAHKQQYVNTQNLAEKNEPSLSRDTESETVERIHVQIRKELADKLLELVYARKREGKLKKSNATQRHIIEQALEEYFEKEGI